MRNSAVEHIDLLLFLVNRYPKYIGTDDIGHVVTGEIRTRQRLLKNLSEAGYVEVIRSSPLSYRIRPDKFEVFKNL